MRVVVCSAFFVCSAVGCVDTPPRQGQPVPNCGVSNDGETQLTQELSKLSTTVAYFLDADVGGPLQCVPGPGNECAACVGDAFSLPVGVQTTVAVEAQNTGTLELGIVGVDVGANAPAGEVVVLEPLVSAIEANEAGEVFVGITPQATTPVSVTLTIRTDARNEGFNGPRGYGVTLTYVGVDE